jgi:truncated hemoglobin YjbI
VPGPPPRGARARHRGSLADIEELVRSFYRGVAMDDVLGPVFRDAGVDWSAHLPKMEFWTWPLFSELYQGQPLRAHEAAHRRTPFTNRHCEQWLELFTATSTTASPARWPSWPRRGASAWRHPCVVSSVE